MANWWTADPSQKYWVEIRRRPGIGTGLICPTANEDGAPDPWYELVASVKRGDVVYHWNAREHRFVGRSVAAANAKEEDGSYVVDLEQFTALAAEISLKEIRAIATEAYDLRDTLRARHGDPLRLPFQFRQDRTEFGFMSNYFAKLPSQLVTRLFGTNGLGGASVGPFAGHGGFLTPFRPKADSSYVAKVVGGHQRRTRGHETLVNACAEWLEGRGYSPRRNAAVDLGLEQPPVVIEAKVIRSSWPAALREAIGQLYEYRYFKVSDPASRLVVLADKQIPPEWVQYLERDRDIGAMWSTGSGGFELSRLARRVLLR